jgi:acyl-coenzyme A thioesterase PaaI-like protein
VTAFYNTAVSAEQVRAYSSALDAVRAFHEALAKSAPDAETLDRLTADLRGWTDALTPWERPEEARLAGRISSLPVRGQLALPPFVVESADDHEITGTVTFGAFFLGRGAAAHGGAILNVFDEVMGMHSVAGGRTPGRTAYLKTDFRAIVPIETPIRLRAWFDREDGRKRFMRGEMWSGDTLCAEADALFVGARPEARGGVGFP